MVFFERHRLMPTLKRSDEQRVWNITVNRLDRRIIIGATIMLPDSRSQGWRFKVRHNQATLSHSFFVFRFLILFYLVCRKKTRSDCAVVVTFFLWSRTLMGKVIGPRPRLPCALTYIMTHFYF